MSQTNSLAHIEVNVSDLEKSKTFYSLILSRLNWKISTVQPDFVGFKAEDKTHLFLVKAEASFLGNRFHRKNIGLNHLAFRVQTKNTVEAFTVFLKENNIPTLYSDLPCDYSKEYDMQDYYAVFFEDPDRIKLEVVFMN